ncbi:ribonuclease H-like domain-containing protein [Tanacetum coccineum]
MHSTRGEIVRNLSSDMKERYKEAYIKYTKNGHVAHPYWRIVDGVLSFSQSLATNDASWLKDSFVPGSLALIGWLPEWTKISSHNFSSSAILLQRIVAILHNEFVMKDHGSLNFFLGRDGDGDPVSDSTLYRGLASALQYLTFTRPHLSYIVQHVCFYMHDPREPHLNPLKRILHYVRGNVDHGLHFHVSSTAQLTAYTDVDWAGCLLLIVRHHVIVFFFVIIFCPHLLSDGLRCRDLVLRRNMTVLPM